MFVKVLLFVKIVKSIFAFPSSNRILLFLQRCFMLVYTRERQRQEVFSIGVEFTFVVSYVLAQLLFLELPNVKFLTRVLENLYVLRYIDSWLRQTTSVHVIHYLNVSFGEILALRSISFVQSFDKCWIFMVCWTFSLCCISHNMDIIIIFRARVHLCWLFQKCSRLSITVSLCLRLRIRGFLFSFCALRLSIVQ
jgi:hypothetical protein